MPRASIFLVGPMGAGKTTVGRRLAALRGLEFIDADEEIEHRTGVDINFIFEKEGEAGFRQREAAVIDDLTRREGVVLATGGGAVLLPENRDRLTARGLVVYLRASVDQQLARTRRSTKRPLLNTPDPRARLEELFRIRDPLYREVADLVVESSGRAARHMAQNIHQQLESPGTP